MHRVSLLIAKSISNDCDNNDYIQMICYSLEAILSTFITTAIAFIIAALFDYIPIFIIYSISFITIRMMHKGFHFKSFVNCCLFSNIMIFISCIIIKYFALNMIEIMLFYFIIALHYYISIERNKVFTFIYTSFFTLFLVINTQISYSILIAVIIDIFLIIGRKNQCKI